MRYFIVGGSNSVMSGGWASRLIALVGKDRVVNLSIGASPSLMAYYRLSTCDQLKVGDVVVWEYAINDDETILIHGARASDLVRHVKATINFCASRGLRFAPIVLNSRDNAPKGRISGYQRQLMAAFANGGIDFLHLNDVFESAKIGQKERSDQYIDRIHIREDSFALDVISNWVSNHVFACDLGLFKDIQQPNIITRFVGDTEESFFSSQLGHYSAQFPKRGQGRMKLVSVPSGPQRISGLVLMRTPVSGPLIAFTSTRRRAIALQHQRDWYKKPVVILELVDVGRVEPLVISNSDNLECCWESYTPKADVENNEVGGIIAVITEPFVGTTPEPERQ